VILGEPASRLENPKRDGMSFSAVCEILGQPEHRQSIAQVKFRGMIAHRILKIPHGFSNRPAGDCESFGKPKGSPKNF
jgi:hypothetical protein